VQFQNELADFLGRAAIKIRVGHYIDDHCLRVCFYETGLLVKTKPAHRHGAGYAKLPAPIFDALRGIHWKPDNVIAHGRLLVVLPSANLPNLISKLGCQGAARKMMKVPTPQFAGAEITVAMKGIALTVRPAD
jgi:hypothetical protein